MMYPFMTLNDGTEIVHSETLPDGRVKVYIEKPDAKDCFHHVTCYLPDYSLSRAIFPIILGRTSTASPARSLPTSKILSPQRPI